MCTVCVCGCKKINKNVHKKKQICKKNETHTRSTKLSYFKKNYICVYKIYYRFRSILYHICIIFNIYLIKICITYFLIYS